MNDNFEVSMLIQNNIQSLYLMRDSVWIDPPYQRVSDIWSLEKRQLLIDSILNGFDIPKIYFHALTPPRKNGEQLQKYAIIDGKQRLDAVWSFIDGRFVLSEDFEFLSDTNIEAGGLSYGDLSSKYKHLRAKLDATQLSVVVVRTDDIDLIEEMFSRLNEAVPLNAPEKRNAFGGTMPAVIRKLANHRFFKNKVPFEDKRYKHRDLATKLLLIENSDMILDTKKVYLDSFVRDWAENKKSQTEAEALYDKAVMRLNRMSNIFADKDPLLKSIGMIIVLYHFFRLCNKLKCSDKIRREYFAQFDTARLDNRLKAENDIKSASYDLLEFEKYVQSPNDAYATRLRLAVLVKYLRSNSMPNLPIRHPYFSRIA